MTSQGLSAGSTSFLDPEALQRALKIRNQARAILSSRQESKSRLQEIADNAAAVRERCKTFHGFIRESWHVTEPGVTFHDNWHLGAIADHLEAVHRGEIQRLMVNLPPGMMKSSTVSVDLGPWEWTTKPWLRYFTTSYEAGYAARDSRKHRDLVESEWYQALWPEIQLTTRDATDFANTFKGARKAVPFSRLTAGRGNRLIIDDPHSTETAESDAERLKTTRMFRESATSRLNDPERDTIIVMMHRLHPDDICGVIEQLGLPYVKLILPMEYVRSVTIKTPWFTDPRTEEGELLHPARIGREKAEALKVESGEHAWATQYQQLGQARDGSFFFNRFNLLEEYVTPSNIPGEFIKQRKPLPMPKQVDTTFFVMDTASKPGKKRDGTGVIHYGFTMYPEQRLYLLDYDLIQMQADLLITWIPGVLKRNTELANLCSSRAGSMGGWVEDKDSGVALIQASQRAGLPIKPITGDITARGKDGRAVSASGYVYRGLTRVVEPAWDKVIAYKGIIKNHMVEQITTFRMGFGTPTDEDELFDCYTYGVLLAFGDKDAKA